ncbi:flagellar biosynthesis protein FlhA [Candidatus Omnitrophus magneticus]|uniref:Flagellar biosynthesis protein FlhA n=1 Tax=Candidatus Omnitrophus magneticus TaxID=1609969 RepID=A0A0F0CTY5_9BACT|nr:flagellar biosynthesis protein FlhA [Candidatus Omnitrophus magneticus]
MRRQLAKEIGFIVPSIHIRDNLQLRPHEYSFMIRGIEVAKNEVMMNHWLAVASDEAGTLEGIPAKEPAFGLPAYWVEERAVDAAQTEGFMVVDTATVIATHLTELIRKYCWELLTRTEMQSILDNVSKTYPKLVDELIPTHLTLGAVQRVLQNLLRERVPINDMVSVLETLLDYSPSTKDVEALTEFVRQALARYITKQYMVPDGNLPVFTLDPRFETPLSRTVQTGEAINPELIRKLVKSIDRPPFSKLNSQAYQLWQTLCRLGHFAQLLYMLPASCMLLVDYRWNRTLRLRQSS